MAATPIPGNEAARLEELHELDILDTLPEQAYDDITYLAAQVCEAPIALLSLVDRDRQWFKSRVGFDASETPRNVAFCAQAILQPKHLLIVPDATSDGRFANNPLVTEDPSIRFYAGAPLVTASGTALGTLCVIDTEPRQLNGQQIRALRALSRQVIAQLDLRRAVAALQQKAAEQRQYEKRLEKYHRKLERNFSALDALRMTDPLTGLHNLPALIEKLETELARMTRDHSELSLALIEVDDFRVQIDEHGRAIGDQVLTIVARVLESAIRESDFVAHYGGAEFAVALCDTGLEGARVIAERIRRGIEQAPWPEGQVTVSIGITSASPRTSNPSILIDLTDRALSKAKHSRRTGVHTPTAPTVG